MRTSIQQLRDHISQLDTTKLSKEEVLWLFRKPPDKRTNLETQKLIDANLPLVYSISDRFLKRHEAISGNTNIELTELFQAGYLGLTEAVEKYDSFKGTKFSTFAYYHISLQVRVTISNIIYPLKKYSYADISVSRIDADDYDLVDVSHNSMEYNDILNTSKKILTKEENKIFLLYFHRNETMQAVANELNVSTSKIQYSIKLIQKKLQKHLVT